MNGVNEDKFKIRVISKRGQQHLDNNEDAAVFYISGDFVYLGVFDGCSSGVKSHFASELHAKLFRGCFYEKLTELPLEARVNHILHSMFDNLKLTQHLLNISILELLSTVVFSIVDTNKKEAIVVHVGDGLHYALTSLDEEANSHLEIIDENNMPTYLIEQVNKSFDNFLNVCKIFKYSDVVDLSISTDGLQTFKTTDGNCLDHVCDYFLKDIKLLKSLAMLPRKYNILMKDKQYGHDDDVTIIRLIFENNEN